MLTIITCQNPESMFFRNIDNYNFQKCWQLWFPEIVAITFSRNVSNICFKWNAGDKCQQSYILEIPSMNVSYYNFQKYWRQMLSMRKSRNACDKWKQLYFSEMLAIYVSNYSFLKCWRQMLATTISRNAGDGNYDYSFWRAP